MNVSTKKVNFYSGLLIQRLSERVLGACPVRPLTITDKWRFISAIYRSWLLYCLPLPRKFFCVPPPSHPPPPLGGGQSLGGSGKFKRGGGGLAAGGWGSKSQSWATFAIFNIRKRTLCIFRPK